jgi:hypothetical protein
LKLIGLFCVIHYADGENNVAKCNSNNEEGGNIMRILLAAVLATVIAVPCMAKDAGSDEDRSAADVQTPGKTEPRVPDTLKSMPDQRIQTEGRASAQEPAVKENDRALDEKKGNDRK